VSFVSTYKQSTKMVQLRVRSKLGRDIAMLHEASFFTRFVCASELIVRLNPAKMLNSLLESPTLITYICDMVIELKIRSL